MSAQIQSEEYIYKCVDQEIANNTLDPKCHALALQQSGGNHDLMIAIYLIKRVEDLKLQNLKTTSKGEALDQRKMRAAQTRSKTRIRYRSTRNSQQDTIRKVYFKRACATVSANLLLLLGSCGLMLCFWISAGSNLYEIPYLKLALILAGVLTTPIISSKIKINRKNLPYMPTLIAFCLFVGLGSIALGLNLMASDPPSYKHLTDALIEGKANSSEPTLSFGKPKVSSSVGSNFGVE